MKTKEEIIELFNSKEKKHYIKSGKFLVRRAIPGETILTIVSGKLETIKTAKPTDFILRNIEIGSSAETYSIDESSFWKRYETPIEELPLTIDGVKWGTANAKGEIMAFEYSGPTIKFMAPWNEEMLCEEGDFIANPIGGEPSDIYRIEKDTFKKTYKLKS